MSNRFVLPHNLPRCVGIMADPNYERKQWIFNLIDKLSPKTIVATAEANGFEDHLERATLMRGDLYSKVFRTEPWEVDAQGRHKADELRDFLFLSYIKYYKGRVLIFPRRYHSKLYGDRYTKRMQELLLTAHQLGIKYTVIPFEDDREE